MTAATLLSRLERVRPTGRDRWVACCPAHRDRMPSLSIRELPDGRVLAHCFGGCGVADVLGAVGLGFDDLFPERIDASREAGGDRRYRSREPRPFPAADVLVAVADEALYAALAASDVASGQVLADDRRERLWTAAGRLAAAVEVAHGR